MLFLFRVTLPGMRLALPQLPSSQHTPHGPLWPAGVSGLAPTPNHSSTTFQAPLLYLSGLVGQQ